MKKNRISLIVQEGFLKNMFPGSQIRRVQEQSLDWIHVLTPSSLSDSYKVKLRYKRGEGLDFYVIEPKLVLADGKTALPHVYSTEEQKLCLFYPKDREWHSGLIYTRTVIPWACEWLQHYEIWVATGEWLGGGIHPTSDNFELEKEELEKSEINKDD